jgi:hypothetical protein
MEAFMNNKLLLSLFIFSASSSYAMDVQKGPQYEATDEDLNEYVTLLLNQNPKLTRLAHAAINKFIRQYYYLNLSESNAQRLDTISRNLEAIEIQQKEEKDLWQYFVATTQQNN